MKKIITLFITALFFFSFTSLAQDNNAKVFEFKKVNGQWSMYSDGTTVEQYADAGNDVTTLVKATIEGREYIMEKDDYSNYEKVYGKTTGTNVEPAEKKEKKEKDKKVAVEKIANVGTSTIPTKNGWIMIPDVSLGISTTKIDKDGVVKKNTFTISNIASTVLSGINLARGNQAYMYGYGGWFNPPMIY